MKKTLLAIALCALPALVFAAQTPVTPMGAFPDPATASINTLKAATNTKLDIIEANRQDHVSVLAAKADKSATVMLWGEWANGASFTTASPPVVYNGSIYKCTAPYTKISGETPDTQIDYFAEVTGSGGSMTYPGAGIPVSTGTAWGTSLAAVTTIGETGADTNIPTEQAVRKAITALPAIAFGTGFTVATDTPSTGTDTVSITPNAYQAYDADLTTWAGVTPGTGVATALAVNADTVGGLPTIIAKGAYTVDTASIAANTCASAVAVAATGVATTDVVIAAPNSILSTVAGFGVTTAGAVRVDIYPTSGNVNFQFCNPTGAAIDPGSVTFNWKVLR